MSEGIPDDVMKVAQGIAALMPSKTNSYTRGFAANVIARAIIAERERCAKIALAQVAEIEEPTQAVMALAKFIEVAIRTPTASIPEERGTEDAPAGPSGNP
jgi:hypothetical protein